MNKHCHIEIDGKSIPCGKGERLLWVALENDIFIPHLCAIKDETRPNASCRLCFVEVDGYHHPVISCTTLVEDGMVVRTRSERVDRLVKTAFELLLSDHNLKCSSCPANRACALQEIAKKRGLKLQHSRFQKIGKEFVVDESPDDFAFDRTRCVLCGQCVWADRELARVGAIGYAQRGMKRVVTTFKNLPLAESICTQCMLCVEACPVGALYYKKEMKDKLE